jgi:RNA polymerase sigma-70 factor (ECF subfamily)
MAARLRASVGTLPPEQQEVVRRRIHDGQTFAEIASDLNLPIGTVLTRMRLALEKLRKQLAEER